MTLQAFFKYFFACFRELFLRRRKKSLLSKELKTEISRFARDDHQWRRWTDPPPTPPKKSFIFDGGVLRGVFNPLKFGRFLTNCVRNDKKKQRQRRFLGLKP